MPYQFYQEMGVVPSMEEGLKYFLLYFACILFVCLLVVISQVLLTGRYFRGHLVYLAGVLLVLFLSGCMEDPNSRMGGAAIAAVFLWDHVLARSRVKKPSVPPEKMWKVCCGFLAFLLLVWGLGWLEAGAFQRSGTLILVFSALYVLRKQYRAVKKYGTEQAH